jgi:hypothetical protein
MMCSMELQRAISGQIALGRGVRAETGGEVGWRSVCAGSNTNHNNILVSKGQGHLLIEYSNTEAELETSAFEWAIGIAELDCRRF